MLAIGFGSRWRLTYNVSLATQRLTARGLKISFLSNAYEGRPPMIRVLNVANVK
jgi:hypothetical protein